MSVAFVANLSAGKTAFVRWLFLGSVFALGATLASAPTPARAADCPGNPDALGTSRTLVVDPVEHPRVGTMQYGETLPLHDHEIVLTFDDGPLPSKSAKVLDILAAECVKATFFIIGRMATAYPEGVRRLRDAGHTIGTHSENHPLSFNRMPVERAVQEINDGITHTAAALGDPKGIAPFFRIPGLLRAEGVEDYLASRGIMTWSADFPADDWRHIGSAQVLHLALSRLEAKGKGILLLHDIQPRTVAMLPALLRELKSRGYRIVHVVPSTPDLPKTPSEPRDWLLHPEAARTAGWPGVPRFAFAETRLMAAPDLINASHLIDAASTELALRSGQRTDYTSRLLHNMPLAREAFWPRPALNTTSSVTHGLPAPDPTMFSAPGAQLQLPPRHHLHVQLTTPLADPALPMMSTRAIDTGRHLPGSAPMLPGGLQRVRDKGPRSSSNGIPAGGAT